MDNQNDNNKNIQHNESVDEHIIAKDNGKKKNVFKRLWLFTIILFVLVVAGGAYSIWTVHKQAVNDAAAVQANLDTVESTFQETLEQTAADVAALQTELANTRTTIEETQEQNATDLKNLQTELSEFKTAVAETQQQNIADLEALQTALSEYKTAMAETQQQNSSELEAHQTELTDIKSAMEEVQAQNVAALEVLQTELSTFKSALEEMQQKNASDLEAIQTDLANTKAAIAALKEQSEEAANVLQSNLDNIETVYSETQEQNETDITALQTALSNAEIALAALVENFNTSGDELAALQTKLDEHVPALTVTRTISTDTAYEGESVMITYNIENNGKVSITNLALQENSEILAEKMDVAATLQPGENAEIKIPVEMGKKDLISKPIFTYTVANGLEVHTFEVEVSVVTLQKQDTKSRTELNWNINKEPGSLDPCFNNIMDNSDIINQTFEGLVREKSGIVYPGIAESWDISEDGLTVTFHLRKSKWSDGTKLTANDFIYAWLRAMKPETESDYNWLWEYTHIVGAWPLVLGRGSEQDVGISAVDDYTLQVQLTEPTYYFVSLMAYYYFMPVKQAAVEAEGGEDGTWGSNPALCVSNGAFMLAEYISGVGFRLEANPAYWNAEAVQLTAINGKFINSDDIAYAAYMAGDLDFIPNVPASEITRLAEEDSNLYEYPLLGTYSYGFNMDLEIWSDVRVRKALALGFSPQLVCDSIASSIPADGLVSPGFLDADGKQFSEVAGSYTLTDNSIRIEVAKALLAQAGYPNGEGFPTFSLSTYSSVGQTTIAEIMQEQWKTNLGINCVLNAMDWDEFQAARSDGDFEIVYYGWLADFLDPISMLENYKNLDVYYNFINYYNPDFEKALDDAVAAADPAVHFARLYTAYDIFMEDMPVIPIYYYTDTYLVSPVVKGWDRSVLGIIDLTGASIVE